MHRLGAVINCSASTLGGEYSFYFNGIIFGGVGLLDLTLHLVGGASDTGMVTPCVYTLGDVWVLFWLSSTILVCVSVVSSLVFAMVCSCKMSSSFLSLSSFYIPKGENEAYCALYFIALIISVASWVAAPAE